MQERLKEEAARRALALVRPGMRLGLGTGSTIDFFLRHLGAALEEGRLRNVSGVPTSSRTESLCRELGIPLLTLEAGGTLDLAVDGADEVSPRLDLIKGLGGALIREKMVAVAAREFVVIADASKQVTRLGERAPVPVEVLPFSWRWHLPFLRDLGSEPELRSGPDGEPLHTDNGNLILDCRFRPAIPEAAALARRLEGRPGVVGHGLFLGLCHCAFIASDHGVEELRPAASA